MRKADDGLRPIFRTYLKAGMFWTSVETGMTAQGVPDSNYLSTDGVEGWLEYKATDANAVKFESEQIGWHLRRARYGGRSWIAVRKRHDGGKRLGAPIDELYLVAGRHVQALAEGGLAGCAPFYLGAGGPARWRWEAARQVLTGVIG